MNAMTETSAAGNSTATPRHLAPGEIGQIVRTMRGAHGWAQETLAELSGLQTRTIQRVERGDPSSLDTRQALARAFGFDDLDFFNALHTIPSDEEMRQQKEAFDRKFLLVDVRKVTGRELLLQLHAAAGYRCLVADRMEHLPPEAQDSLAAIVDSVRDYLDVVDIAGQAEILADGDTMDDHIAKLAGEGYALCAGFREASARNERWADPTPMRLHITYLHVALNDRVPSQVAVSRNLEFG